MVIPVFASGERRGNTKKINKNPQFLKWNPN